VKERMKMGTMVRLFQKEGEERERGMREESRSNNLILKVL